MKIRILIALLCLSTPVFAQQENAFARANQEYAGGNSRAAIDLYEGLASQGEISAALFYNLGNAYFRGSDAGRAILNYERALALEPHHPEAEANLRLVREKARALELRQNTFERLTSQVTLTQLVSAAVVTFWIALFALALLVFARPRSPVLKTIFVLALLAFAGVSYGVYLREAGPRGGMLAIVTAPTAEARVATADSAGPVLILPPGSEIKILSTRGDWIYAALPNDLRGWLPAQSAEKVRL